MFISCHSSFKSATFAPATFPSYPSSLSCEAVPELLVLKEKFEKGILSLEDAESAIENMIQSHEIEQDNFFSIRGNVMMGEETYNRPENEKEFFYSVHEHSSSKRENTDQVDSEIDLSSSGNASRQQSSHNPFLSIYHSTNKYSPASFSYVDESDVSSDKNTTASSKPADKNNDLSELRLARLENMLQTLINQMNESSSSVQPRQSSLIRAPQPIGPALVTSGTSMVSALSNPDNFVEEGMIRDYQKQENDQLRKEIDDLKRQLAYAQNQVVHTNTLCDTTSTSTGVNNMMKKKKRSRKLLKQSRK